MKTILTTVLFFAAMGTAAYATGLTDPIVEPEVVVADAVHNSSNVEGILAVVAVIAIILGAAGAF